MYIYIYVYIIYIVLVYSIQYIYSYHNIIRQDFGVHRWRVGASQVVKAIANYFSVLLMLEWSVPQGQPAVYYPLVMSK